MSKRKRPSFHLGDITDMKKFCGAGYCRHCQERHMFGDAICRKFSIALLSAFFYTNKVIGRCIPSASLLPLNRGFPIFFRGGEGCTEASRSMYIVNNVDSQ